MIRVSFDTGAFSQRERAIIERGSQWAHAFSRCAVRAVDSASAPEHERIERYFGRGAVAAVSAGVRMMHAILDDESRRLWFVDRRDKMVSSVCYNGPGVEADLVDRERLPDSVSGFVHLVDDGEARTGGAHVGSGMRIYLGSHFWDNDRDFSQAPFAIYHEVTHKVLGTEDMGVYTIRQAMDLARTDPRTAVRIAYNWQLYLFSFSGADTNGDALVALAAGSR